MPALKVLNITLATYLLFHILFYLIYFITHSIL